MAKSTKIIKPQEGFQEKFVSTNVDFCVGGGVLNPQPDFEALYFVAESGGRHVFSNTFDEHRRNIKRIRGK